MTESMSEKQEKLTFGYPPKQGLYDPANEKELLKRLQSEDAGVRYWAMVGLFHIQDRAGLKKGAVKKVLEDESHHVRLMAAWALYRDGEKETAMETFKEPRLAMTAR